MTASEEDIRQAASVLGLVSTLLDTVDWDEIHETLLRAESLGPILDPTAFMETLHTGTLRQNQEIVRLTRDYLAGLHEIHEKIR